MKLKVLLLILLVFASKFSLSQDSPIKEILQVAESGYIQYLGKIPIGHEARFGFKNREEFMIAKIGRPYQILLLKQDFFSDTIVSGMNYLFPSGEWRIAVTVNDEYRTLLTVAKMNGDWKVVGIGAAGLAGELGEYEKKNSSSLQYGMILRILQLDCEFIINLSDTLLVGGTAFFLNSANIAFEQSNGSQTPYPLYEILLAIKKRIGNK